jgi:hypothetical protein
LVAIFGFDRASASPEKPPELLNTSTQLPNGLRQLN